MMQCSKVPQTTFMAVRETECAAGNSRGMEGGLGWRASLIRFGYFANLMIIIFNQ